MKLPPMKLPCYALSALAILLMVSTLAAAETAYRWVDKDGKVHYSDQPPPKEIKKVEQRRIGASSIDTSGLPFASQQAARDFPVTLYTAPDCTAECEIAREFLNKRSVPFRESTVSTPADAVAYRKTFGNDKLFLPSIVVGSQKQQGYSEGGWNSMLDDARYPRSVVPGSVPKKTAPAVPAVAPEPTKAN